MKIPISEILCDESMNSSRQGIKPEDCVSLAASIDTKGLMNPVIVKEIDHPEYKYQLVVGYRRFLACWVVLGYTEIEATIDNGIDKIHNLVENIEREDPSYWEVCCALKDVFPPEYTCTQVGKEINRSRDWVRARWLLWKMPEEVLAHVEAGLLSPADVAILLPKSEAEQIATASLLAAGKKAGKTTQEMASEMKLRVTVRKKQEVQRMMTELMSQDRLNEMHTLRWALGQINDEELFEELK